MTDGKTDYLAAALVQIVLNEDVTAMECMWLLPGVYNGPDVSYVEVVRELHALESNGSIDSYHGPGLLTFYRNTQEVDNECE